MNEKRKAVIYARTSTEQQADDDKVSITEQLGQCRQLCDKEGFEVVGEYVDKENYRGERGKIVSPSGTRKDRPAYRRMIEKVVPGGAEVVVAWKEDRLYRGIYALVPFVEMLNESEKRGRSVEVQFVHGVFDRTYLELKAAVGQIEIRNMQERMMMGKRGKVKKGEFEGGVPPYGYRAEDGKLVVDEDEAEVVRRIFWQYTEGVGTREITRRLNLEGVATRKARSGWSISRIYERLHRECYRGKRTFDGLVVECPGIIDEETWELAQERLRKNRRNPRGNTSEVYLLQHLLYCEECGRKMIVHTRRGNKSTRRAYRCRSCTHHPGLYPSCQPLTYVPAEPLENEVWGKISALIDKQGWFLLGFAMEMSSLRQEAKEIGGRIGELETKLANLERQRTRAITLATTGTISQEDLQVQLARIDEQHGVFVEELREAKETLQLKVDGIDAERRWREWCSWYRERREWLNMEQPDEEVKGARREIARALIRKVWINAVGQVRIEGEIPEPPEPAGLNRVVAILPPEEEGASAEAICRPNPQYRGGAGDEGAEVDREGGEEGEGGHYVGAGLAPARYREGTRASPTGYSPTSFLKRGSSRMLSKSESVLACSTNFSSRSIASLSHLRASSGLFINE